MTAIPNLGQVVYSCAGRDKGRAMVVVRGFDGRFVWVADGTLRRVSHPKRKNIRHLRPGEAMNEEVAAGLLASDGALRRWLMAFGERGDEPS